MSNNSVKQCNHSAFITLPVGQFQYVESHGFHFMKYSDSYTGFGIYKEMLDLVTACKELSEYDWVDKKISLQNNTTLNIDKR